jgi:hypothetical protein
MLSPISAAMGRSRPYLLERGFLDHGPTLFGSSLNPRDPGSGRETVRIMTSERIAVGRVSSWVDDPSLVSGGSRPADRPGVREGKQVRFNRFCARPDSGLIADLLWHYVRNIPCSAATEGEHWAVSCLPGGNTKRLTAISLRTMETIVITTAGGFLIVSQDALLDRFGSWDSFENDHPELTHDPCGYQDAGLDQIRIAGELSHLHDALLDDRITYAIRVLTERVSALGRTIHSRGHCPQLADLILDETPPTCDGPVSIHPGTGTT